MNAFPWTQKNVGQDCILSRQVENLSYIVIAFYVTLAITLVLSATGSTGAAEPGQPKPNVLFLAVDDMKDWVNCLGGYEGVVHTPNIDRLARRGMLFTNAHCPSPKCAPSRAAIMTGLRPSTTGLYDNKQWWRPNLPDVVTIPVHFRSCRRPDSTPGLRKKVPHR